MRYREVGDVIRLRPLSRGLLACIAGGGHIVQFWDIFNAENPTQVIITDNSNITLVKKYFKVSVCMVQRLKDHLKDIPPSQWSEHWLCYDNLCNVVFFDFFWILNQFIFTKLNSRIAWSTFRIPFLQMMPTRKISVESGWRFLSA